jgi:hypothetical protein
VKACVRDPEAVYAKRMETQALDRLRKNPGAKLAMIEDAEGRALLQHLDLLGDVEELRLGLPVTEKQLAALAALPKLKRVSYLYRSDWATELPPVCRALPVSALLPGSSMEELGPEFFIQAGKLPHLEELVVADLGNIGDRDAAALARSTSLRKLWTSRCAIGPAVIQEIAKIRTLEDLYLSASCRPTEEDFKALGGLERLRSLILGDTVRVTAAGLAQFQRVPGLQTLKVDGNGAIDDAELEAISGISTLTELWIWNPSLKDEANLLGLAKLKNLKQLMLALHLAPKGRPEVAAQLREKLPGCLIH